MAKRDSTRNGSIRVVLYLRMSSAGQDQSIPAQRAELEAYAKKHGYVIVGEYIDEAISGDDTERRTGFLRMREDAQAGEFDVILSWDQDRFGRFDPLDAGYWIYPFRQAGVRLETIAQGRIDWEDLTGQLIYSVNQMGKAQFLRDLSRNTCRGLLSSAREGRAGTGGPSPYGYHSKDGEVSVIPDEAKIVRWIFRAYLKPGASLRGLAGDLNRRKIKPPRGKIWRDSSVRAILARRKYTGTFVYGERNSGKYHSFRDGEIIPRRKADKSDSAEPIVHENHFEAIVDQDTFDRVQAKLDRRKTKTAPRTTRQYALSGMLRCGDCGGSLGGMPQSSGSIYRCREYHHSGTASCYCNSIKEAPLVSAVVRKVQDRYLSDSALDRLRRKLVQAQERSRPQPRDLSRLRREVKSLDRKISNGEDAVFDAPPNLRPGLYRKLEGLTTERDRLKVDLETLTSRETRSSGNDSSEIESAIEALKGLGAALSKAGPGDTRELLSSIVSKIELHFDHEPTKGGRTRNTFTHGMIYLRPDSAGGERSEPNSTPLRKLGPKSRTGRRRSRQLYWGESKQGSVCQNPHTFSRNRPSAATRTKTAGSVRHQSNHIRDASGAGRGDPDARDAAWASRNCSAGHRDISRWSSYSFSLPHQLYYSRSARTVGP